MNNIEVLTRQELECRGSGVVSLAVAPDGLPVYQWVAGPPGAPALLQAAAQAMHAAPTTPELDGTPLEPVAAALEDALRAARVRTLQTPSGAVELHVIPAQVRDFAGATMLSRLLEAQGGAESDVRPRVPEQTNPAPAAMALDGGAGPTFRRTDLWLGVCVKDGRLAILRREVSATGWPEYAFARYFVAESLAAFHGATFVRGGSDESSIPATNVRRYQEARGCDWDQQAEHAFRTGTDATRTGAMWTVRVPRNALAHVLLELTMSVARLHGSGQVHGDIKPSNVLVTGKGVQLFDGLGLAPGERSPGMTLGWAAPEQVLTQPVSPQTDQYAIGLLLLALLGGVAYGEQTRVLVPRGGTQLEEHTLLRNPAAFVDPALGTVDPSAIEDWRNLIERCLRFDAADRHPATLTLADALKRLVGRDTLLGHLEAPVSFGRVLGRFATRGGEVQLGWLARGGG